MAAQARGLVLEIGVGSGANLPLYGPGVSQVIAIDPCPHMLSRAARVPTTSGEPHVALVRGDAADLPLPDASVDTVVAWLVLCSVARPEAAARELRRVLKTDGRLLVFEHVRAAEPRVARWQRRLDPLWTRLAGGCHLDRDTGALVRNAGFRPETAAQAYHPAMGPSLTSFVLSSSMK